MKPTLLVAGRNYSVAGIGGARTMKFLRRERAYCGRSAVNYFQCDAFRGLNGPTDTGICTLTDYRVARFVEAAT